MHLELVGLRRHPRLQPGRGREALPRQVALLHLGSGQTRLVCFGLFASISDTNGPSVPWCLKRISDQCVHRASLFGVRPFLSHGIAMLAVAFSSAPLSVSRLTGIWGSTIWDARMTEILTFDAESVLFSTREWL